MNTELKNAKKSSEITPEELKNQLICGIIEMTNEERQELLALWKELQHEKLCGRKTTTSAHHI